MKMTKGAPKRAGGQGTGHLKNPAAFSGTPGNKVTKHPPVGHPKKGGKAHVKGK